MTTLWRIWTAWQRHREDPECLPGWLLPLTVACAGLTVGMAVITIRDTWRHR